MKVKSLWILAVTPFLLIACSSDSDEGGTAITEKPANFHGQESSAAGVGAPTQSGSEADRPGLGHP